MEIMRQYRILVVDDDQSILKLVKNVLELDAYDVTTLDRIEELELTHFVGYDLILLDVMMEPVNGFELYSTAAEVLVANDIPIFAESINK